jgi:hypothetical protein
MVFTSGLKIVLPQAPDYTRRAKFSKISASQGASLVSMTQVRKRLEHKVFEILLRHYWVPGYICGLMFYLMFNLKRR